MPKVLKICDYDGRGVLAFDLKHLLPFIANVGVDLTWHVVPWGQTTWFLGELSALKEVQEFSNRVEGSDAGVELNWHELGALADSIHQTVHGTFVGVRAETPWPGVVDMFVKDERYVDRALSTFYETAEMAIQAVDSSYWLVYVRDADVRERIRAAFCDVEVIDVGE